MSIYKNIENNWKIILMIIAIVIIVFVIMKVFKKSKEQFTNDSGYYCDPKECDKMTISECMKCSNCGFCMSNSFDSKCVSGAPRDLITSGQCDKVYANDVWTRAVMAGDNDYRSYENKSLFA